jgi:hypothetical protein
MMINVAELSQYFPKPNTLISESDYRFTITFDQEADTFIINLRIRQKDAKESHLIKFRIGIGKDKETNSKIHDTAMPHFEIDYYRREDKSFSAIVRFTFEEATDELLLDYAKGTVVVITKILESFIKNHGLSEELLQKLVYSNIVIKELSAYEKTLLKGLYLCYKKQNLVVRRDGEKFVINSAHNLEKYLNHGDLKPLYLPLKEMAEKEKP